jgi:hypothetical protein
MKKKPKKTKDLLDVYGSNHRNSNKGFFKCDKPNFEITIEAIRVGWTGKRVVI